jgi:hypothetical protein
MTAHDGSVPEQLSQDMAEARHRIMRLFGGMGSISDVVLYREGHLLTTETTNFINCCRHSRRIFDIATAHNYVTDCTVHHTALPSLMSPSISQV